MPKFVEHDLRNNSEELKFTAKISQKTKSKNKHFTIFCTGKPWKFGILYRSLNDSEVPYTYQVWYL